MLKEVVFAGFGGQGVLTAGLIVAHMALKAGCEVSWMPAYGPSMRGGKAYSVVKFGDGPLGSPDMEDIDILAAMNQPSLEYVQLVKKDGIVFINSNRVADDVPPEDGHACVRVACASLAQSAGNQQGANLVMIGAIIKRCGIFEKEFALAAMKSYFKEKGKARYDAVNEAAFLAGYGEVPVAELRKVGSNEP